MPPPLTAMDFFLLLLRTHNRHERGDGDSDSQTMKHTHQKSILESW